VNFDFIAMVFLLLISVLIWIFRLGHEPRRSRTVTNCPHTAHDAKQRLRFRAIAPRPHFYLLQSQKPTPLGRIVCSRRSGLSVWRNDMALLLVVTGVVGAGAVLAGWRRFSRRNDDHEVEGLRLSTGGRNGSVDPR
jgi:hypothetical protein